MIIDTHVHVWELNDQHQPAPHAKIAPPRDRAPVEWLLDDMERFHIDHCVLVQSSAFGWDNSYVLDCLRRYPGQFRSIGLVDPLDAHNADALRAGMLAGLSGIRLHPVYYGDDVPWIDSTANDALWNVAAETGAILQFHMRPIHAPALRRMIARHPTVRVIVDHLAKPDVSEAPPYPSYRAVLDVASFNHVWVKIGDYQLASREPYPWRDTWPFVQAVRDAFGADRMLWGTGYPATARLVPLGQALAYVQYDLPSLTPDDVHAILDTSPRRLFGF